MFPSYITTLRASLRPRKTHRGLGEHCRLASGRHRLRSPPTARIRPQIYSVSTTTSATFNRRQVRARLNVARFAVGTNASPLLPPLTHVEDPKFDLRVLFIKGDCGSMMILQLLHWTFFPLCLREVMVKLEFVLEAEFKRSC